MEKKAKREKCCSLLSLVSLKQMQRCQLVSDHVAYPPSLMSRDTASLSFSDKVLRDVSNSSGQERAILVSVL